MNVQRKEANVHKDADKIHQLAQNTGDANGYIRAAELYEKAGDFEQARLCREAAERLA